MKQLILIMYKFVTNILFYAQYFMNLQRKTPARVFEARTDGGVAYRTIHLFAPRIDRLQKAQIGGNVVVLAQVLTAIDHLQFVAERNNDLRILLALDVELRRKRNPIDIVGQRMRSVGFDSHKPMSRLDSLNHLFVDHQRRLAARQNNSFRRIAVDFGKYLKNSHFGMLLVASVAERATQIASRKANKHCRSSRKIALTLKAIKYLVDFKFLHRVHKLPYCLPTPQRRRDSSWAFGRKSNERYFRR